MKKYFKNVVYILCLLLICSCDYLTNKFCGEPFGKQKIFIDSINLIYKNRIIISQVPCYPGYMEAKLKVDISNEILDSLEFACIPVYCIEFLVYDKSGILIRGNKESM